MNEPRSGERPVGFHPDVYDALPIGIVETDLDQRIVRCNRAFAVMVGEPAEDIVGTFGWDHFHPDSPPPDPAAVAELRAGRRSSYSVERLLRGPDGSGLAVQIDWARLRDETGEVTLLLCAVTDISERARTTAELQRARERADVLWRQAPIGIIESTTDGVIISANNALGAMLDRDPDELVGTSASELSDPAGAPAIQASIRELVRSGERSSAERRYVRSDGRSIPVHVSAAALRDETGIVERVTAFVVDVTEAHTQRAALARALAEIAAARDELARRQHFTDALLETIDVGIVSCDAEGTSVVRNSAERRLLGLTSENARSQSVASSIDVLAPGGVRVDPENYPLARALRGETVTDTEFRIGPRGGPLRDVVMRATRITIPDASVLGAVVAITDVTAERTALRELAAERERLDQAQRLGQIGSFSFDLTTNQFTFSREIFRIWGLPPTQISPRSGDR